MDVFISCALNIVLVFFSRDKSWAGPRRRFGENDDGRGEWEFFVSGIFSRDLTQLAAT